MTKIALVSPCILPLPNVRGGGVELLIQYFIELNEINHDFDLTVFSIKDFKAIRESKKYLFTKFVYIENEFFLFKYIKSTISKYILKLFKVLLIFRSKYIKQIDKYLFTNDFDKLIVENCHEFLISSQNNLNCDKYYHIHFNDFRPDCKTKMKELQTNAVKGYKRIVCISEFIKKQVEKTTGQYNTVLLNNCIDTRKFTQISKAEKDKLQDKYQISDDDIVILYSGRIISEKGILELILAFKKLCNNYPLKLLIVGAGTYSLNSNTTFIRKLKSLVSNIKEKVIFTGYIEHSEIHKIYNLCDFTVIPTLYCEEAAGLVAIEALASGKPVIISDSGGLPEYVNEDCSICVNRNKDFIFGLEQAIETLINNKDLRIIMGIEAIKLSKKFDMEEYYNNYKKILFDKGII